MGTLKTNRKAQGFNPVRVLILCLVAGILLIIIGYRIVQTSDKINDEEKCRLSIFARDKIGKVSKGFIEGSSFECPPDQITITKRDVVLGGRIQEEKFKDILLKQLYSCYRKVGAGKLDPYRKTDWGKIDDTYCLICGTIQFDKKLIALAKEQDVAINGLLYDMASRKIPGQKVTLYQATHGGSQPSPDVMNALRQLEKDPSKAIQLNSDYVTVWRFEKYEKAWYRSAIEAAGVGTAVAAATIATGGGFLVAAGIGAEYGLLYAAVEPDTRGGIGEQGKQELGGALGILLDRKTESGPEVDQQVWLLPEEKLSGHYPSGEKQASAEEIAQKEFCTVLSN